MLSYVTCTYTKHALYLGVDVYIYIYIYRFIDVDGRLPNEGSWPQASYKAAMYYHSYCGPQKLQTFKTVRLPKKQRLAAKTRKCGTLKAARRNASAKLKCLGAPGHQRPNFGGCIYIHYTAPPYSASIRSIYLLPFGKVWLGSVCWFPCATPGNEASWTQNSRSVDKNSGPILSRLWTKVHEILGQCRDHLCFEWSCRVVYGMLCSEDIRH